MKNAFKIGTMYLAALFVTLVMFGSWLGGTVSSKVEAGLGPLTVTEMVIDVTTANIILGGVETTSIAEILIAAGELNRQFENKIIDVNDAIPGTLAVVKRAVIIYTLLDQSGQMVGKQDNYMAYHWYSPRHSIIGWTRPSLA